MRNQGLDDDGGGFLRMEGRQSLGLLSEEST